MIELVQLERRHQDFDNHGARIIVVSMDGLDDSKKTQEQCPHLIVLSDEKRGLSQAAGVIHARAKPGGDDADAPTTILVDRGGIVRWLYRSPSVAERLSPDELLGAIDKNLTAK